MPEQQQYVGIVRGVAVGSYGQTILVTLKDLDGAAQDVSAYTGTKTAIATSPDKTKVATATITFNASGTDGVITWTWASGDIDRPGNWELQIVLNSASARVKSYVAKMPVIPGLRED